MGLAWYMVSTLARGCDPSYEDGSGKNATEFFMVILYLPCLMQIKSQLTQTFVLQKTLDLRDTYNIYKALRYERYKLHYFMLLVYIKSIQT